MGYQIMVDETEIQTLDLQESENPGKLELQSCRASLYRRRVLFGRKIQLFV